ncbi:MAG: conjugal transfer protein TraF [Candidatus Eisenbacteria bacterium]
MNKKTIVLVAIALAVASAGLARESTEIMGARYLGMGGCFVAASHDRSLLFANPAALDRADEMMFTVMGLASTVNTKTPEVIGFLLDNRKDFEDLGDMNEEDQNAFFDKIIEEIDFKRMNVMLSTIPFGMIRKPFGGALFTDTRASAMAFNGAGATPLVDFAATQDVGGVVGYGYGWTGLTSFLPNRLSVGGGLKYIQRYAYSARETVTEMNDGDTVELMHGNTFGLDIGLLYDVNPNLCFGAAVYDVFASEIEWEGDPSTFSRIQPGDTQKVEPALRIGLTYNLPWRAGFMASPVMVACDLAEPFDGDLTFFKKVHVGAETSFFKDWFQARLGVSQGYPTFGLSIWLFTYAYYTEESGRHAGQMGDSRHMLSFEL